ncbi:MAG: thiamine pyrophosphate-binding protein, partial [Oscillochloris sp.]|nr:thiamine pyrophosphate-binding protein [Oscillochloris sp.]
IRMRLVFRPVASCIDSLIVGPCQPARSVTARAKPINAPVSFRATAHRECAQALATAVERLGLPVYLSGGARGLLGRTHPLLLRHQRRAALKEADLVILAGVPADFRLDYGRGFSKARVIAANRSRAELRRNLRPQLAVQADVGLFLRSLAGLAPAPQRWHGWLAQLRSRDEAREAEISQQAEQRTEYLNPLYLCRQIEAILPDDAMLIGDGGDFVATAAYTIAARRPLRWLDPGPFGTLGVGAGFAIGAAVCLPNTPIWVIFGDGALGYSLAEFDTFVRHKLPITAVVGNDAGWTQISRDQVTILGSALGTVLAPSAYHEAVNGLGATGIAVADPELLEDAFQETQAAVAAGKPVLLNARIGATEFRKGSLSI